MRSLIRSSIYLRAAAAAVGLWLGAAGAAWAGDGGDLGSLQALLNEPTTGLCKLFGIASCPVPPTITQAVLEVAALGNNLPEMVRVQNNIPPGTSVTAGNPAVAATDLSALMAGSTPLAFNSGTATQLYNPNADTFLYAVAVSNNGLTVGNLVVPDTAHFIYDDLFRNNVNFSTGATVAKFLLPLTVLNSNGTERAVPAVLNFIANPAGDCSTSTVVANFPNGATSLAPAQIGIDCRVRFGASPTSAQKHTIFEVTVRLLVTGAMPPPNTDPAYFYTALHRQANPVNAGVFTAFLFDEAFQPVASPNLGPIGLAPTAAPLCTTLYPGYPGNPSKCPPDANAFPVAYGGAMVQGPPFALCASLPVNNDTKLRPAVGAYYAMAASGEMFLSAPVAGGTESGQGVPPVCPPL